MSHMTGRLRLAALGLVLVLCTGQAEAGRAFLFTAYGTEQLAMAGADVAVSRDVHALNTNPAGLLQLGQGAWDGYLYGYYALADHQDSLGNDEYITQQTGGAFAISYAQRLERAPDVVLGIGFYGQGGTGIGYENLLTDYGTHDEISSDFGVSKMIAALGVLNAYYGAPRTFTVGGTYKF